MDGNENEQVVEKITGVAPATYGQAEWYMREKLRFQTERNAIKSQAQLMLNQIDAEEKELEWNWGKKVEAFARIESEVNKKSKIHTMYGTLSITNHKAGYKFDEEEAKEALKFAEKQGWFEAIKTEEKILKGDYQKKAIAWMAANEGEIPPGLVPVQAHKSYKPSLPKVDKGEADTPEEDEE